jgi:hypothetical protein
VTVGANNAPPFSGGTGSFSASTPVTATIAAGGSQDYTFTFQALGAGSLNFFARTLGYDAVAGVTTSVATSGVFPASGVTIFNPVSLTASISLISPVPGQVFENQVVTVRLNLTNNSSGTQPSTAVAVTPAVGVSPANFTLLQAPSPGGSVAPGNTATYDWTFSATGTGNSVFSVGATGFDFISGILYPAVQASAGIVINPASAGLAVVGQPGLLQIDPLTGAPIASAADGNTRLNAYYQLTMTVQNTGTLAASQVTATALVDAPGGNIVGDVVPSVVAMAVGEIRTFTWTFSTTGAITPFNITANLDVQTLGKNLTSSASATTGQLLPERGRMLIWPELLLSYTPILATGTPGELAVGQNVLIRMTVSNTGLAMLAVTPTAMLSGGTAVVTELSAPAGQLISPNLAAVFTWVYRADVSGTVHFSVGALGQDAGVAPYDPASPATAVSVTLTVGVQRAAPAFMPSTLSVLPAGPYSIGQQVTVFVSVSNTAAGASDATVNSLSFVHPVVSNNWGTATFDGVTTTGALGGATISPLAISPGSSVAYAFAFTLTSTTSAISGSDTVTITFGGTFTDTKGAGPGLIIGNSFSVNFTIQPTEVRPTAVKDIMFFSANYFNPPSQSLTLYFSVSKDGPVKIKVFNIAGELVRTLFDDFAVVSSDPASAIMYSGRTDQRLIWDGKADDGLPATSGTYLVLIEAPHYREIRKVNLLR